MHDQNLPEPLTKKETLLALLPELLKYKKRLVPGFLFILLTNFAGLFQPVLLQRAIDALKGEISEWGLLAYAGAILAVSFAEGVFLFLMRQSIIVASRYIEYDLRNRFFAHLQRMAMRFFHRYSTGDLMARATNDLNSVRALVGPGIMYFVNTIVLFIGALIVMLSLSPELTAYAVLPLPVMVLLVARLMRRIHDIFKRTQEQFSAMTTHAQENISGIRVVKAYVQENREIDYFRQLNAEYIDQNMRLAKIRGLLWASMGFLAGLGSLIILWIGGGKVAAGEMTIGTLAAFFALVGRMTWPMVALGWVINMTQQGIASMGRINEILRIEPDIRADSQVDQSIQTIRGEIEFRHVSFRYTSRNVLEDIDLKIEQGKTLAVVGPVGSGKTTLINLIPRLLEATQGTVFIDGRPIAEIPPDVLRKHIGYTPQETFLFSETIRENINFGVENASFDDTVAAAKIAQVLQEIESFPQRFETLLGERGINLSGGQKQRTAISRAIIRKPSILLLDDALSSVDTYTEEEILKRLRRVMRDRTCVITSHRISTIRDADEIIVLQQGRIVERGSHETLLAKAGVYADLFRKQQLEAELETL